MTQDNMRNLFLALISLRDTNKSRASKLSGVLPQNIYNWFCGNDSAISEKKRYRLLAGLGFKYNSLNPTIVHRWCVKDLDDMKLVLNTMPKTEVSIYPVKNARYPYSAILGIFDGGNPVWVVAWRPLMAYIPAEINTNNLRDECQNSSISEHEPISIDNDTWQSLINAKKINIDDFNMMMAQLIDGSTPQHV